MGSALVSGFVCGVCVSRYNADGDTAKFNLFCFGVFVLSMACIRLLLALAVVAND
jgi:hypothetical protein